MPETPGPSSSTSPPLPGLAGFARLCVGDQYEVGGWAGKGWDGRVTTPRAASTCLFPLDLHEIWASALETTGPHRG